MQQRLARFIVRTRVFWMALFLALSFLAIKTSGSTRVNYDLTSYLAENTETKRGLDLMNGEFLPTSAMSVVLIDASEEEAKAQASRMSGLDGVIIALHDPQDGFREQDGHAYLLISVTMNSDQGEDVLDAVQALLADTPHLISGGAMDSRGLRESINSEMPTVMVVSCVIVFLILLAMTTSFVEPIVFFIIIAVSILLNMGSNWIFDSISFITFAVTAILQLALAMDYSIMLMNSFDRLRARGADAKEAMAQALCAACMPIASSALTTVAGMMALVFMSFTMGYDIGMVLAKGIILSMLTVFLLMPGLLLLAAPLLDKTRHKPLTISGKGVHRIVSACHGAVPIALIALILFSVCMQGKNVYTYSAWNLSGDAEKIGELFGQSNQLVLVYPRDDSDAGIAKQQALMDRLTAITADGKPVVKKIMSMVTTGKAAVTYYDVPDLAQMLDRTEITVRSTLKMLKIDTPIRGDELLRVLPVALEKYQRVLPEGVPEQLAAAQELLDTANRVFNSPHYSRALLDMDLLPATPPVHAALDEIRQALHETCGEDTAMAGWILALDDIALSFSSDLQRVSAITVIFVFLIVLISFRSFAVPLLLVCVIQGAIWINMCFSNWYDGSIFFMCYLICMGLQMGATIDYGILLTSHYRSQRAELAPAEASARAISLSLQTIVTSGMALMVGGFSVGIVSTVYYISAIGTMLARGALVSVALVIFLLPKLLQWLDRWIVPKQKAA